MTSKDLYIPPLTSGNVEDIRRAYCQKRATLLEAMSGGGRYGFDAPYFARGIYSILLHLLATFYVSQ